MNISAEKFQEFLFQIEQSEEGNIPGIDENEPIIISGYFSYPEECESWPKNPTRFMDITSFENHGIIPRVSGRFERKVLISNCEIEELNISSPGKEPIFLMENSMVEITGNSQSINLCDNARAHLSCKINEVIFQTADSSVTVGSGFEATSQIVAASDEQQRSFSAHLKNIHDIQSRQSQLKIMCKDRDFKNLIRAYKSLDALKISMHSTEGVLPSIHKFMRKGSELWEEKNLAFQKIEAAIKEINQTPNL